MKVKWLLLFLSVITLLPILFAVREGKANEVKWVEYWDPRYGYGLAVPSHWTVYPTPLDGYSGTATFANFNPPPGGHGKDWPEGTVKMDINVDTVDPDLSLERWLEERAAEESYTVETIRFIKLGRHMAIEAVIEAEVRVALYALRLSADGVLTIGLMPEASSTIEDVQAVLNSVVFSNQETISLPTTTPAPLIAFEEPEAVPLQSGSDCGLEDGVDSSPIPLHMPFAQGTTWMVGGWGSFYGDGAHTGNDYYATDWNLANGADETGQPLYPVAAGTVVAVGYDDRGYGNYVKIDHKDSVTTLYAHLHERTVKQGDTVYLNTKIGTVGSTGNSTGPHLHLSFWVNGVSRKGDPQSRRPSPMIVPSEIWLLCDASIRTVVGKPLYTDVPMNHWAKPWVDAVSRGGIIQWCPDTSDYHRYCPDEAVTRAYMAVYLLRAIHGPDYVPPPASHFFADMTGHWAEEWVDQLYREEITSGCATNPLQYCPNTAVKRVEMAVFLLRVRFGADYTPPAPSHFFADMIGHWGEEWAEALYLEGITAGCAIDPLRYCPENPVLRAEMAVFMARTRWYPPLVKGAGGGAPRQVYLPAVTGLP